MNILYYTTDKLHATKGGTERTTITVASALKRMYGCRCYSIYERPASSPKENCVEDEFYWNQKRDDNQNICFLREIIVDNKIDVVIVQGAFIHVRRFREASKGLNCKIIFAHHFQPRWELVFFRFKDLIKQRPKTLLGKARWIRNILLFPQMRANYEKSLAQLYREAYDLSDRVILLSKEFVNGYKEYGNFDDDRKFTIIPNGLSFDEFVTKSLVDSKKPIALIVSRLDDTQKKISMALKIWKQVKQNSIASIWQLNIVGEGPDKERYLKMVRDEKIPDVHFFGRQNPIPFYKEASLFMMTSRSESWGLTLTEAQQMGVVPTAFDTYESLRDIITDRVDGRIISPDDMEGYASALIELMSDKSLRNRLATAGIQTSKRFSPDKIAERWWNVITEKNHQ